MANPEREAGIRARLKVPTDAKSVVLLAQNSHLDWDWNAPFRTYLHERGPNEASVTEIFERMFALMRGVSLQLPERETG